MPGYLAAAERWTVGAARVLATVGLLALIGYAVLTLADGVLRSLIDQPIDAVRDLGGLVAALAVLCCFPLAFLQRSNITIRVIGTFFGAKASQVLDSVAAALMTATMALIAWRFFVYAGQEARAHDTTFMLSVSVAPFWYAAAVLVCVATAVQGLILMLEISRLLGREAEARAR